MSAVRSGRGFTLVELLVSITILVAVGWIITGTISSALRATNKTNNVENIRQNGNYALSQISKNIQYAQIFDGLSNNGEDYVTSCPDGLPTVYNYIKVTPLDSSAIEYKCIMPSPPSTDPPTFTINNGNDIIDTSTVDLRECSITCTQATDADVPIIGISFTLALKKASVLAENSSPPIEFKTSVEMRNYRK